MSILMILLLIIGGLLLFAFGLFKAFSIPKFTNETPEQRKEKVESRDTTNQGYFGAITQTITVEANTELTQATTKLSEAVIDKINAETDAEIAHIGAKSMKETADALAKDATSSGERTIELNKATHKNQVTVLDKASDEGLPALDYAEVAKNRADSKTRITERKEIAAIEREDRRETAMDVLRIIEALELMPLLSIERLEQRIDELFELEQKAIPLLTDGHTQEHAKERLIAYEERRKRYDRILKSREDRLVSNNSGSPLGGSNQVIADLLKRFGVSGGPLTEQASGQPTGTDG